MSNLKKEIGNRIKYLRTSHNYTQKELADKLGLNGVTVIANYESGYSTPNDEIKLKLSELFHVSIDYLLGNSEENNQEDTDFRFAYHKECEGLSDEEIKEALEFYKLVKNKNNKK